MVIKLARGPLANKRYEVTDYSDRYEIREPVRDGQWLYRGYPDDMKFEYRRGHYQRSNVKLKDGTIVFEWMGWVS